MKQYVLNKKTFNVYELIHRTAIILNELEGNEPCIVVKNVALEEDEKNPLFKVIPFEDKLDNDIVIVDIRGLLDHLSKTGIDKLKESLVFKRKKDNLLKFKQELEFLVTYTINRLDEVEEEENEQTAIQIEETVLRFNDRIETLFEKFGVSLNYKDFTISKTESGSYSFTIAEGYKDILSLEYKNYDIIDISSEEDEDYIDEQLIRTIILTIRDENSHVPEGWLIKDEVTE